MLAALLTPTSQSSREGFVITGLSFYLIQQIVLTRSKNCQTKYMALSQTNISGISICWPALNNHVRLPHFAFCAGAPAALNQEMPAFCKSILKASPVASSDIGSNITAGVVWDFEVTGLPIAVVTG